MTCTRCHGTGTAPTDSTHARAVPCHTCSGTGAISEGTANRIRRGHVLRLTRRARKETQQDAAARLGMTVAQYATMERGE